MSERVRTNFRGLRALVLPCEERNREILSHTLARLGFEVEVEGNATGGDWDVVIFDADQPVDPALACAAVRMPAIALVGVEAPSRLARIVRQRCCGYLLKPIRTTGIFTALVVAFNEFAQRQREAAERNALAARLAGRRTVTKAVIRLMGEEQIDDDEAFRRLRGESMRRRLPVEARARELLERPVETARALEKDALRVTNGGGSK
jgi:two-component system, response regulator / RNA-binding antiterminator